MDPVTQISAAISTSTKEKLDRFTRQHGLKKNHVLEQALLFFLATREQLPEEALVPTRVVVTEDPFARIAARLSTKSTPNEELQKFGRDPNA